MDRMDKVREVAKMVGEENVQVNEDILRDYSKDLHQKGVKPLCVVRLCDRDQVREIVRFANITQTPLIPVSSSPPRFRGDTVPLVPGTMVVDLSNLRKIIDVDRKHRVALFEPGVTFDQLVPSLAAEGLVCNMPLMPKRGKSVVASLLERTPPVMPKYQWDASDPLACLEIVFGNGEVFRTGQAAGPGTFEEQRKLGVAFNVPFGPGIMSIHRLVQGAQGTFGIVTWTSMRCEVKPTLECPFFVASNDLHKVMEFAYWLVRLGIPNECFILDSCSLAALLRNGPRSSERWILFFVLAGGQYFPEERVKTYKELVEKIAKQVALAPSLALEGCSAYEFLQSIRTVNQDTYWKLAHKGGFFDIGFFSRYETLPVLISEVRRVLEELNFPLESAGFYIQPVVQGTSYYCEVTLYYEPHDNGSTYPPEMLERSLITLILRHGGLLRPYGRYANDIMRRDASSLELLRALKRIFDPNGLMNPGKLYE